MAPLPHNNTDIYYLDYTVCGISHTLENRVAGGTTPGEAADAFTQVFAAMDPQLFLVTIDLFRFQAEGSNVSLPVTWPGPSSFGSGAGTPADGGGYAAWVGRSTDGRRVRWTIFGSKVTATAGNWRAYPGENADLDTTLAAFTDAEAVWLTISGEQPVVNQYTNNGYNAYWRNKTR